MTATRRFPLIRLLTAGVLLAAGVFALPGTAKAECGDHLRPMAGHDPAGSPADGSKKPCDGPGCSGDPTRHPLPLTAPSAGGSDSETWAATGRVELEPWPTVAERFTLSSAGRPVRRPPPIFHPPPTV